MEESESIDFEAERAFTSKDTATRRRYLPWLNKRREDFATEDEYNDFLETREDIIYNVVNNIDVDKTLSKVKAFRRENEALIGRNNAKKDEEDRVESQRVCELQRARAAKLIDMRQQDEKEEKERQRQRQREEAEELLRIAKGDEALAKLRRKREKREKKEKKRRQREEAAARAAQEAAKPDLAPKWFRPVFNTPLPVPVGSGNITSDQRPMEDPTRELDGEDRDRAARAAGFSQQMVYERALAEFNQSLDFVRHQAHITT